MRFHYDLHIHSCLSPCSDDDMTPNNIVNMALLKGLDLIAVSDHNTVGNLAAVQSVGKEAGLLVVPAMELCTSEEIHLLCLFPDLDAGRTFEAGLYGHGAVPQNRPEIFGEQLLMDETDNPAGIEKRMLIAASGLDVDSALRLLAQLGGVAVPAHVDRDAYSMIATLGVIPAEYGFNTVELSRQADASTVRAGHPETIPLQFLVNSDAHHLWDISEPVHSVELPEQSISALIQAIRCGTGNPSGNNVKRQSNEF